MSWIPNQIENLQCSIHEIAHRAHRNPKDITLVAVSKAQDIEKIKIARTCGLVHFGENYVQEFLKKWPGFNSQPLQWHFIGHLQTNKVKDIVGKVVSIDSVDRINLIQKIESECAKIKKTLPVLLQINIGEETSKSGILPNQFVTFVKALPPFTFVKIQGLMAIPPQTSDPEHTRSYFKKMFALFCQAKEEFPNFDWRELSMGMSWDYPIAIEEGATQIRIGSLIFGKRST
ncbi:MAG: YggS family pyridoxal phosphate-dependent enzyme [Deltaproteobacteria bacterium]|nr:YggS family pyridoxal phosphate-dependent enzyme [Deltaproteobacteria bacterium]